MPVHGATGFARIETPRQTPKGEGSVLAYEVFRHIAAILRGTIRESE